MSEHKKHLEAIKSHLVEKRRQLAEYATAQLTDHTISNLVECQLEIDAINRALADEKDGGGYSLDKMRSAFS